MKKDVLVAIRGLQIDESSDEDAVEILVNGRYNAKNGRHFLRFEQYEEDGTPTKNDHKVYEPFFGWYFLNEAAPTEIYTYTDLIGYGPESNMGYDYVARERRSI